MLEPAGGEWIQLWGAAVGAQRSGLEHGHARLVLPPRRLLLLATRLRRLGELTQQRQAAPVEYFRAFAIDLVRMLLGMRRLAVHCLSTAMQALTAVRGVAARVRQGDYRVLQDLETILSNLKWLRVCPVRRVSPHSPVRVPTQASPSGSASRLDAGWREMCTVQRRSPACAESRSCATGPGSNAGGPEPVPVAAEPGAALVRARRAFHRPSGEHTFPRSSYHRAPSVELCFSLS
jgi:hypothetical protein